MKILLTGATGFIGAHVARLLAAESREIYVLARGQSDLWRIRDLVPQLHLVQCDLLDLDKLDTCLAQIRPELCLHLAWYAAPGKYLSAPENLDLLQASLHLAARLAHLGCRRLVGVGTCLEYDVSLGYLSETTPTKPQSLYAASKLALQLVLEQLAGQTGMKTVWGRLFYQYGPFEDGQRLASFVIHSLLRDQTAKVTKGEQVRDYLHVEDVAAAIWTVAQSELCGPVNIGSGRPVTVREVVTQIGVLLERLDLIVFDALPYSRTEPMFICANNRRLVEQTDWAPRYNLEQGLRQTIAWWQQRLENE